MGIDIVGCGCPMGGGSGGGGGGRRQSSRRRSYKKKRQTKAQKNKAYAQAEKKGQKHQWFVLNKIFKQAYRYKSADKARAGVAYASKRMAHAERLLAAAQKRAEGFDIRRGTGNTQYTSSGLSFSGIAPATAGAGAANPGLGMEVA